MRKIYDKAVEVIANSDLTNKFAKVLLLNLQTFEFEIGKEGSRFKMSIQNLTGSPRLGTGTYHYNSFCYNWYKATTAHYKRLQRYKTPSMNAQNALRHEKIFTGYGLELYLMTDSNAEKLVNLSLLTKIGTGYKRLLLEDCLTYVWEQRENGS